MEGNVQAASLSGEERQEEEHTDNLKEIGDDSRASFLSALKNADEDEDEETNSQDESGWDNDLLDVHMSRCFYFSFLFLKSFSYSTNSKYIQFSDDESESSGIKQGETVANSESESDTKQKPSEISKSNLHAVS